MLIKEESGKINFIDKNDAFVGFDWVTDCCEDFDYFVSKKKEKTYKKDKEDLEGYFFDTSWKSRYVEKDEDYYNEENIAIFKCVNEEGDVLYLHLYNSHNGYYSHGWNTSWGCEGYL